MQRPRWAVPGLVAVAVAAAMVVVPFAVRAQPPAAVPGATAPRAVVTGVDAIDRAAVERLLSGALADSLDVALAVLAGWYADAGYLGATFQVQPDSAGLRRVHVEEGEPARIAAVHVRGTDSMAESLAREILDLQPGSHFRPPAVEARLGALVDEYARRGRLDAEVVLERYELNPEGVVLGIAVTEGEHNRFTEVQVRGNTVTRAALVQRLAGLATPQPADIRRLRDAPLLLRRSGLFADVGPPQVYRVQGADMGVVLHVVESDRRHTAFGAFGAGRDPGQERTVLNGRVDLALRNIYGTGRDFDLRWSRDGVLGSFLAFGGRERFLLGSPVDLSLAVSQTVRDSTSTWQTLALMASLPLNRNLSLEGGGAADRTVFHIGTTGSSLRWRAGIGLRFASLGTEDASPRWGAVEVRAETARRDNDLVTPAGPDQSRVTQTIWGGRFQCGEALGLRHVIAARGEWHALVSDEAEVPVSELFEFGGQRTLRGYREGQFRGDEVAYGGIEYRYGDRRAAQVYGFLDAGTFRRRRAGASRDSGVHFGTGVGFRAEVATGALDLSFAVGEERSFSAMKVHVGFRQRF